MKKHTKVVLSRIVASALVVGAMFSNVIADPALDTAPAAVEEVADSVVTPGGVSVGNGDEATEETTVVEDVTEETTANTAVNAPETAEVGVDYTFDFRDGSIVPADTSYNGNAEIKYGILDIQPGTQNGFGYNGADHGSIFKAGNTIAIEVAGPVTLSIGGCQYSKGDITVTNSDGTYSETRAAATANCLGHGDDSTIDFAYTGGASVLTINFSATTYVPVINIFASQDGSEVSTPEVNRIYNFDFTKDTMTAAGTYGFMTINEDSLAANFNGAQHGVEFKDGNTFTFPVSGNTIFKFGGCQYSAGSFTATASDANGKFVENPVKGQTSACYHQDGTTADITYVGGAGTVTIAVTGGKMYVPNITVVPARYDIDVVPYEQKTATVNVNGTTLTVVTGATITDNATVTVSKGEVVNAGAESAKVKISLGKQTLSDAMLTEATGCSAKVVDGSVVLTFDKPEAKPYTYTINVADTDATVDPQPGDMFNYQFTDKNVLPQDTSVKYSTFSTDDGIVTFTSPTETFAFHDGSHGANLGVGDSISFKVAGNAIITFATCQYSQADAVMNFTDAEGNSLGSCSFTNNGAGACGSQTFSYKGNAGVITATLAGTAGLSYLHGLTIQNEKQSEDSNGKIDVWDFGGAELDSNVYNNRLTADIINGFYGSSIAAGSSGNVAPSSFSAGNLSWVGGINDRIRTSNEAITRYDTQVGTSTLEGATGRLYINKADDSSRCFSIALKADDIVTVYANSQAGGSLTFERADDPTAQSVTVDNPSTGVTATFVAEQDGTYKIYGKTGKPSYYRIVRQDAKYCDTTINVATPAGFPTDASLVLTNTTTGKNFDVAVTGATVSAKLPTGYTYSLSLKGADEYVVATPATITVADGEETKTENVTINAVDLVTVTGSITGLDAANLAKLAIVATVPEGKIYQPKFAINAEAGTYTVKLEKGVSYALTANGVNDYSIGINTISADADSTKDVAFAQKTLNPVKINLVGEGASISNIDELKANTKVTFTNLNEEGYVYTFGLNDEMSLRAGTYTVALSGYNKYPVAPGLISNLTVTDGAEATKDITLNNATKWSFGSASNDTLTNESAYNGLVFTGAVKTESGKAHLVAPAGTTIEVPVKAGQNVNVGYYYQADFTVNGQTVTSNSGSTSKFESSDFTANADGTLTITVNTLTYFTGITVGTKVPYAENIYVGADKEYKTINDALAAVRLMDRPNSERVTINVDPGDYQEMLVIDVDNVTLKNTAANPDTALINKGVNITENGVRVTSYYIHGYNYFSMTDDCKYDEEVLKTNKENGYLSFENPGSGTTKNSYWNATVTVRGTGFEADGIIFENSANQYISTKEANDVVQEWTVGGKGTRPTTAGDTSVQNKSFVERAAAIAILGDKAYFNNCKFVGRQDTLYGASNIRAAFNKCTAMGGTDFIFGGMVATFYKSDIMMNTSEDNNDVAYLTAAQQASGRGYLMYDCNVVSTTPGVDTASEYVSKPGYFGRPWQATTSEVAFVNTTVGVASDGTSLVTPAGWSASLGGEANCYEYNTKELAGVDNSANRVAWSTVLTEPKLADGTELVPYTYTQGTDGWNPIKIDAGKVWGDVDGNGVVEANDAALTLQYTLRPEQVTGFDSTVANVSDGTVDGVINAYDAALILQKSLDNSFKFPFEKGGSDDTTETTTETATEVTTDGTTETTTNAEPSGNEPKVYVVGDSTACHYGDTDDVNFYYKRVGFGDKLQNYLTGAQVVNLALSGRSSKSFATGINENGAVDDSAVANYTQLKENIKAGDTLIIAWGHNDEKTDSYRFTDPNGDKDTAGSFKNSLYENYIKIAQDAGATPVLCTPIVRRTASGTWGNNDLHVANGGDYAQAVRDLGSELGITVIDSLNNTKSLYDTVGVGTAPKDAENGDSETVAPTGSAAFHATDQGLVVDNTHLNEYGASMVAYMMAKDIKASNISLASKVGDIAEPSASMLTRNAGWAKFNEGVWNRPEPAIWKLSSPWEAMAFGSGVSGITEDSHPNHDAVQKDANTFEIVVRNNKGKIAGSEDGMMMAFQEIGANDDFTLTATATVNEGFNATNQIGFGLICRDNMFIADNYKTKADYVTAGYTQQSVGGNSTPIAPFARLNGTLDKANVLESAPAAGDSIELKLTRKDGVYTAQYGNNTPVTYSDVNLAALNADHDYVGMFVSRNADITFSNVSLTVGSQTTDEKTVYVVGDSTACHYGDTDDVNFYYKRVGFGDKLQNYLTGAQVVNLALSGRSSKSFATGINENGAVDDSAVANYTQLKENIKAGDTLIIAWGHNDEKTDSYRFTDPNGDKDTAGSFKNSLYENYIKLAQDKGATPILCTPIVRRTTNYNATTGVTTWANNDVHVANNGDYAQAVRDLGSELGITVIDSLSNTKALYESLTPGAAPKDADNGDSETVAPTGSAALHATDQGLVVDNTHLNDFGATMVAYMMAKDIQASNTSLASNVTNLTEPTVDMLTRNANWVKFNEGVWNRPEPAIWKLSSPWEAMAFGSGVSGITEDSHPNHDAVQKDANTFEIVVRNNKGKIAGSEDGMMMAFQEIGANDDFTLTATATVNEGFNATNQIGFGLICRDNMFIADNYKTKADYVTAGYTQQSVGGNSTPIAPFARLNGTLDKANVLESAPAAGDSIELKLTRKDGVYTAQYGNNTPVTYTDVNLAALNAGHDYVGMFVSRNADITFSNVSLTVDAK